MKSVKPYPMEQAIDRFLKMFYSINEDAFKSLFVEALKTVELTYNQVWDFPRALEVWEKWTEYRAEGVWEQWNNVHRNLIDFWSILDDTHRQVIVKMAAIYTGDKK